MSININDPDIQELLKNDNIENTYNADCLPLCITEPTTEKAVSCWFEKIRDDIYEPEARMIAFRTNKERLLPWIKTLNLYYFEILGGKRNMNIGWEENPTKLARGESLKTITIDVKNTTKERRYKITFFVRTGLIQVQGNQYMDFIKTDFPELLSIIHQLAGPIEEGPETLHEETNPKTVTETETNPVRHVHSDINNNPYDRLQSAVTKSILNLQSQMEKNRNDIIACIKEETSVKVPMPSASDSVIALKSEIKKVKDENIHLKEQIQEEKISLMAYKDHHEKILKAERELHKTQLEQHKKITNDLRESHEYNVTQLKQKNEHIEQLNNIVKDTNAKLNMAKDELIQMKTSMAAQISPEGKLHETRNETGKTLHSDQKPSVLLIGTSNIKGIDEARITNIASVTKAIKYTIKQAKEYIDELFDPPSVVVLHVLTNDLKSKRSDAVIDELFNLTTKICAKWPLTKLIISSTTPRLDSMENSTTAQIINVLLKQKFSGVDNIFLADHSNMLKNGNPNRDLLKPEDKFHLNESGTAILASNLKRAIHVALDVPIPRRRPRSLSRPRTPHNKGQSHK